MQVIIIVLNTIMTWHVIQTPRDVRLSFFIFAIASLVSVPHAAVPSPGYYILAFLSLSFKDMDRWMDGMATTFLMLCVELFVCCCVSRECLFVYYCLDIIRLFCVIYVKVFTLFVFAWTDIALRCCYGVGTAVNLVLHVVSQTDISITWTQINTFMMWFVRLNAEFWKRLGRRGLNNNLQ